MSEEKLIESLEILAQSDVRIEKRYGSPQPIHLRVVLAYGVYYIGPEREGDIIINIKRKKGLKYQTKEVQFDFGHAIYVELERENWLGNKGPVGRYRLYQRAFQEFRGESDLVTEYIIPFETYLARIETLTKKKTEKK